jgi:hypothetical protein
MPVSSAGEASDWDADESDFEKVTIFNSSSNYSSIICTESQNAVQSSSYQNRNDYLDSVSDCEFCSRYGQRISELKRKIIKKHSVYHTQHYLTVQQSQLAFQKG